LRHMWKTLEGQRSYFRHVEKAIRDFRRLPRFTNWSMNVIRCSEARSLVQIDL
jgi:hypothetical protein